MDMTTHIQHAAANGLKKLLGSRAAPLHVRQFEETPIDRLTVPQQDLDLANRVRTNPFSWRGQFSPQLVEVLLAHYAQRDSFVLDPFVGAGTTLFEAARKALPAAGVEINPAAVVMARTALFLNLRAARRQQLCSQATQLLQARLAGGGPLFARTSHSPAKVLVEL
ncbi:MAG: DNA methyltransferase, partial [Phycisphaerae bacterium]|nr:DNA methyltransferase [Phycisphaerae bacterium]